MKLKNSEPVRSRKYPLLCEYAPTLPIPEGKRVPFGWQSVAIDSSISGSVTRFTWPHTDDTDNAGQAFFRVCTACDVREEKRIDVLLADSGTCIGTFDIRYAYVHQVFEIPIPDEYKDAVMKEGLNLRMVAGEKPYWIFYDPSSGKIPLTLQPHIMIAGETDRLAEFYHQFKSVASIQPFGWLEGCVLDGLYNLDAAYPNEGWRDALVDHLRLYLPTEEELIIENHLSDVSDNKFYSHESTLPLALIAQVWPDHPIIDKAILFWQTNKHGMTTEGCYTMGYPLAVVARQRSRADLAELSVRILLERKENLAAEWGIWQRKYMYRNWARACAWYTLGFIRSAVALREAAFEVPQLAVLETEIKRIADAMISLQRPDGLWSCYIDDEATAPDTSGSAGIAAALAVGAKHGLLPAAALHAAQRAFAALQSYLTPDGLLAGAAQNNRGGEALQKSDYRTISQMAMGLMGQLAAALGSRVPQKFAQSPESEAKL